MASTASTEHLPEGSAPQESPLHERDTIPLRTLIKFVGWFVIGLIAVQVMVWVVFVALRAAVGQERQVTGVDAPHIEPPDPRLQPSVGHNRLPADDLAMMRSVEQAELRKHGLIDENGKPVFSGDLIQQVNGQAK